MWSKSGRDYSTPDTGRIWAKPAFITTGERNGVDTILTCDNGIAAIDEIAWAKAQKMTVLVTDHHAVPFEEHEGRRTEKRVWQMPW